jgi:hypothetical protein
LKRLRLRSAESLADAERLVSLLRLLDHPHVHRVRELLPYGDEVVLVLDHAEGGSLDQLVTGRGGLDPGEIVTAVAPVAEALHAAHERGLVHGDITPEAILFTADGRPLLADLGILALIDGGEALGTHGYADPAEAAGVAPTAPGDVYGLAAVCYTALTGLPPHPGQPRHPLPEAVPGVPVELAHAVAAGLQASPARRPAAGQFADLLFAACAPAPVRFPVGLVLSDADIATVLGGAPGQAAPGAAGPLAPTPGQPGSAAPAPGGPGPGEAARQDPFVLGLTGGVSGGHGSAGPVSPPSGSEPDDVDDLDERDGRRRFAVLLGGGLALLLLAAAVVGGVLLGRQDSPAGPATLAEAGDASRPDNADAPASRAPGRGTPPPRGQTAGPRASTTPQPKGSPAGDGRGSGRAQVPAGDTVESWRQMLAGLDAQRAKAFAESDAGLLRSVYVNGSELLAKDQAEIDKCVRAGCHVEGLTFDIIRLDVVSSGAGRAVLKVVDQMQGYTVVSDSGARTDQPPGEVTTRQITLQRSPGGRWLIARIVDG